MCMKTKTGNIIFRLWDGIFKEEKKEVKKDYKKIKLSKIYFIKNTYRYIHSQGTRAFECYLNFRCVHVHKYLECWWCM